MTRTMDLQNLIQERLESGVTQLPPWSEVAIRLREIIRDTDFTLDQVVAEVEKDPALTGEVLKAANSSFFGGLTEITRIKDAAVRLGATELIRLATLITEKRRYTVSSGTLQDYMEPLWNHSHSVAIGSCWLAEKLGYSALADEAFIAGLLHDVGSLLLIQLVDEVLQEKKEELQVSPQQLEDLVLTAHNEMGARLAEHWGLPGIFIDVIRNHHCDNPEEQSALLNLVCLADKTTNKLKIGLEADPAIVLAETPEAEILGARDILLEELLITLEDAQGLV